MESRYSALKDKKPYLIKFFEETKEKSD
jgi:hypothetical protein